ncbi:MAG: protein kinase, partial [Acidobacteria bacterium]|nr:protein kinase [Acidobacteriota bacterium]
EELGRGGMGVVLKAFDPTLERTVAIKSIAIEKAGAEREELLARLKSEAKTAATFEHPHIVPVLDAGSTGDQFYMVMPFVQGRTLQQSLSQNELLPVPRVLELFQQLCEALDYAHQRGVVHRDIKPSNIIIGREGTGKILDFGVAVQNWNETTRRGTAIGTPNYMSPEQAQGERVDHRTDIFSLGAVLYEALTGEKAFPGSNPTTVIQRICAQEPAPLRRFQPVLPPALEAVVAKCLAKDPFQRYQSAREVAQALQRSQRSAATAPTAPQEVRPPAQPAAPSAVLTMPPESPRRFHPWMAAAAALLVLALAGLGWLLLRGPSPSPVASDPPQQAAPTEKAPEASQPSPASEQSAEKVRPAVESGPRGDASSRSQARQPQSVPALPVYVPPPALEQAEPSRSSPAAQSPTPFRMAMDRGQTYEAQGKWEEALAEYRQASTLAPMNAEVHLKLANVLTRLGRVEEAKVHHKRYMELKK